MNAHENNTVHSPLLKKWEYTKTQLIEVIEGWIIPPRLVEVL